MHTHHTKDKGDLAVAKAHADLVVNGYVVLFPATEHAPFDLVAYRDGVFQRIQVKYRTAYRRGALEIDFRSVWSDRRGIHRRPLDKAAVELFCVYCPDTGECYYLRPADFPGASVTLRLVPSGNGQSVGVHNASDFRMFPAQTLASPVG